MWLMVLYLTFPMISSISHYSSMSTFHHLSQFVLKVECLHYVSVENRMQKYGQGGFFHLCGIQTSKWLIKDGVNEFQCLIWIFWVCRLSPAWYKIDCSQLISLYDRYQLQLVYPTREHHSLRHLQHETLQTTFDMLVQSQHILYKLQISSCLIFCVSVAFLPFLKH